MNDPYKKNTRIHFQPPEQKKGFILLIGIYAESHEQRKSEILKCLNINTQNNSINSIIVFWEEKTPPDDIYKQAFLNNKIKVINHQRRITFDDLFKYSYNYLLNNYIIISNNDIYFDESINELSKYDMSNKLLCLTRWDLINNDMHFINKASSQDSWIFKSPLPRFNCNWNLGILGCEQRMAYEAENAGIEIINPSKTIKAIHLHESNIRRYTESDRIHGDYITIKPTELSDNRFQLILNELSKTDKQIIIFGGAHYGSDVITLAKILPKSTIYAFEPDPRNIRIFKGRYIPNNISLIEAAIGEKDGEADFWLSNGIGSRQHEFSESSSLHMPKEHLKHWPDVIFTTKIKVKVRSLDSFCSENKLGHINLIYLDIQGAEVDMLNGSKQTIKNTDYLFTEYADTEEYSNQITLNKILSKLENWTIIKNFIWSRDENNQIYYGDIFLKKNPN